MMQTPPRMTLARRPCRRPVPATGLRGMASSAPQAFPHPVSAQTATVEKNWANIHAPPASNPQGADRSTYSPVTEQRWRVCPSSSVSSTATAQFPQVMSIAASISALSVSAASVELRGASRASASASDLSPAAFSAPRPPPASPLRRATRYFPSLLASCVMIPIASSTLYATPVFQPCAFHAASS